MQIDCDLPEKREVVNIVCDTGVELDAVLGRLLRLWRWVERHFNGLRMDSANVRTVSALCGGDEKFWKAVEAQGWISFEENAVCIPGYAKRFSKSAKRRALDAKRKSANTPHASGTNAESKRKVAGAKEDLEKRREEKSKSIEEIPPLPPTAEPLRKSLGDWIEYKREKNQSYKPSGLKAMVSQAIERAERFGVAAVDAAIQKAMANGWQGWDQENSFGVANGKQSTRVGAGQRYLGE